MLTPGMTIGGLRLDRLLGRGAMGEVYLAEQLSLKRPVAVKRIADHLLDNPEAIARFEREAQCVARLQSPHVVQVFDFLRLADAEGTEHCLIVMELVEGGMSLRDCLGQGPLSWQQAASLALQAAEGLAAALDTGVVHRDVKPDNIMLNRHGVAKLADFGLARAVDSTAMTQEGSLLGTPNYIAPEGCRGEVVGHSGDLYSLGATWFHLATGQPPYRAENLMALLRLHLEGDIPKLRSLAPETPAPLADLVEACLAKDPADRPASARALVDALQALATQGIVIPSRVSELVSAHKVDPGQTTVATAHGAAADTAPLLTAGPGSDAPTVATVMPDRPASHDKLGQATAATVVAGEVPTLAQPSPVAPQAVPSKSRLLPMIAGLAVLVLATGAGVGLWLQSRPDQHDEQQAQATPSPAPQVTNSLPAAPATSDPAPPEAAIPATTIASAASSSPPATPAPEPANPSTVTATTTPASPSTATPATELASPSTPVPAPDADSPATATANTATPSPVTPQTPLAAPVETPVVVATTATPQATPPSATPPTATPVTAAPIVAATAAPTIQADAPAAPSAPDATPAAAPPSTPAPTNQPLVADPGTNPNPTPAAAASDGQLQPAEDPSLLVMAEIQRALSDNDDALVRRWLHELPADHPERQRVESALSDLDLRGDALANALEQAIADGSWGRAERLLMQVRKHEPRLLMDRLRMTKIDIHKGQARMLRQITDATTALKEQRWRDVVRNLEQVPTAYDIATIAVREQRAALQRTLFTTVDPLLDQQFELARQAIAANKPRSARDALDAATDLALAADRLDELAALRLQLP